LLEAPPNVYPGASRGLLAAVGGWLLFIAVETVTQVVFKYAGATLDDRHGFWRLAVQALETPVVLAGFALYFCGFLIWMTILKNVDLGRAFPMTGIVYVTTLASAVILFHESLSPTRIAGVVVIALGVVLLASDTGRARPAPASGGFEAILAPERHAKREPDPS
jgi:drug/metabolite transporter (DMT)-like permease